MRFCSSLAETAGIIDRKLLREVCNCVGMPPANPHQRLGPVKELCNGVGGSRSNGYTEAVVVIIKRLLPRWQAE